MQEETDEGNEKMLIDEFVDLRVRAGETDRLEREREHARRAGERENWLRSLTGRSRAHERRGAAGATHVSVAPAASLAETAEGDAIAAARPERELAHAAR
ncbi:hypothetical protein [Leifsonia virtsii]|uniref:Uncharacterized protein n=1 Tax=Leifsonia virtsii TaxID=3035915 RepID=A0ABT8IRW9_9MICO|nr:hypothetical protein [Leifsonia virtsii]MDN4595545.1 hypothetical protein [Leifsonia virtsii]